MATPGKKPASTPNNNQPPPSNRLNAKSKPNYGSAGGSEHTNNARPSTKGKHQQGAARKQQDRQGSKGMKLPPRRKPDNWKGPWPPKN